MYTGLPKEITGYHRLSKKLNPNKNNIQKTKWSHMIKCLLTELGRTVARTSLRSVRTWRSWPRAKYFPFNRLILNKISKINYMFTQMNEKKSGMGAREKPLTLQVKPPSQSISTYFLFNSSMFSCATNKLILSKWRSSQHLLNLSSWGKIKPEKNLGLNAVNRTHDLCDTSAALHYDRRGHGFDFRSSLNFFQACFFLNCLGWVHTAMIFICLECIFRSTNIWVHIFISQIN